METALNSLGLKELKDQLPKYVYHLFAEPYEIADGPFDCSTAIRLYPHQVLGVSWMLAQEKSRYKGGLLADEM